MLNILVLKFANQDDIEMKGWVSESGRVIGQVVWMTLLFCLKHACIPESDLEVRTR